MSIPETNHSEDACSKVNDKSYEDTIKRVKDEINRMGIICFTSEVINQLTSNLSESCIVGRGGYGVVYQGKFLDTGEQVAIKKLENKDIVEESVTFMAEVRTVSNTNHRNLIKLKGYCFEPNLKALVYEFMKNGSLDSIIYKPSTSMKWEKLYDIAVEIAYGLKYLHEDSNEQIIHYDIKAGNVLLDNNLSPKIADFGLAKLIKRDVSGVPLSGMRGTPGYTAPELRSRGFNSEVTNKCDVYSFGMLLFEILGKRNIYVNEPGVFFPEQVWNSFDNGQLEHLLDNIGITKENRENAIILSKVALLCIQYLPENRPPMMEVWLMLRKEKQVKQKPAIPNLLWGRPSASSMTSSKSKYQLSDDDFNGTSSGSNERSNQDPGSISSSLKDNAPASSNRMSEDDISGSSGSNITRSNQDPESISSSLKDTTHGSTVSVVHQPSTMEEGTRERITYENGAIYVGTLKNGLRHGKGKIVWTSGNMYDGEWKDDLQEGTGKFIYEDGDYYEGEYKKGVKEGKGKFCYVSGNEYVGELKNGKLEGQGKFVYKSGNEYVGEFKNGKFEGHGRYVYKNGNEYVGDFKNWKFEGHGKFIYKNGSYHEGTYKNDRKDGKGRFVRADGKEYHGEWINGIRQDNEEFNYNSIYEKNDDEVANQSTHNDRSNQWNVSCTMEEGLEGTWKKFTYESGAIYEGTWKNGLRHGKGRILWTNGNMYVGEWKDDFKDGWGKWQCEDGDYYEGAYKKGKREGQGKYVGVNVYVYIGEFKNDVRGGQGKYVLKSGNEYVGEFKDGKFEGHGRYVYKNGNEYVGEFKNWKFEGHGKFIYKNGSYHEGTYKNDLKDGKGRFVKANGEERLGEWKKGHLQ